MDKTDNYVLVKVLKDKRGTNTVTLLEEFPNRFSNQFRLSRFEYYSDEAEANEAFRVMTAPMRKKQQNQK